MCVCVCLILFRVPLQAEHNSLCVCVRFRREKLGFVTAHAGLSDIRGLLVELWVRKQRPGKKDTSKQGESHELPHALFRTSYSLDSLGNCLTLRMNN